MYFDLKIKEKFKKNGFDQQIAILILRIGIRIEIRVKKRK